MEEVKRHTLSVIWNENAEYEIPIKWVLSVFGHYCQVDIDCVTKRVESTISIGFSEENDLIASKHFWQNMDQGVFSWETNLGKDLMVRNEYGSVDLLATAFYFLNCIWERADTQELDHWGRSQFNDSVWFKNGYDRPFNHVNRCFDALCEKLQLPLPKRQSELFLSHDIDAVYSGWMEDGLSDLKRKKISTIFKLSWKAIFGKPSWFNFDTISKIEERVNFRSTFYWINYTNKVKNIGKNADYKLGSPNINSAIQQLTAIGHQHGLHKSINSTSIAQEVAEFPLEISSNRHHYLKFQFADLIQEMNQSSLSMDASLGYAEVIGYRNGYSLPFVPFDLKDKKPSSFVEVPLAIMDATLSRYQKLKSDDAIAVMQEFIEENKVNSVISILWHNSHFTNIKYLNYGIVYERVLHYASEQKIASVQPNSLINSYLKC